MLKLVMCLLVHAKTLQKFFSLIYLFERYNETEIFHQLVYSLCVPHI